MKKSFMKQKKTLIHDTGLGLSFYLYTVDNIIKNWQCYT